MNEKQEEVDERWLDRLDEIVDGVDESSPEDDELLQLARQLHVALAPFRELDAPARAHRQRLRSRLRVQLAHTHSWKKWALRPLMVAAAVLFFILLGPGVIFELNLAGQNNHPGAGVHGAHGLQGWQMSGLPSTLSYDILPPANIPRGLVLLLSTGLAPNAYLLAVNVNNYGADAPVKGYLVYEQNALIYETPSPPLPAIANSNSVYQTVYAGINRVFVAHSGDGQNRLEWYQDGLLCDLVSDQPVAQLVAMIRQLQPVTY
ncbi:MAG TPA: hypothetical protein VKR83_08475 [Ktedonobacteraceae bacterium]|nr:hypothetical protein [Ktedonobacteraceae bacterium]